MLEIEALWGKHPGWFVTLDSAEQARLLGWFTVRREVWGGDNRAR